MDQSPTGVYRNSPPFMETVTRWFFTVRSFYPLAQPPSWRTTFSRLSATAYSIYLHLPSISGGRLLHPQPEDALYRGDTDAHDMIRVKI